MGISRTKQGGRKVIAVIGHVDAGKTTLIKKLSGRKVVETRDITQESFFYLERSTNLIYLDTPGHSDFEEDRQMGLEIADYILLVVDVSKGFRKNEAALLEGSKNIILCWSKTDLYGRETKDSSAVFKNKTFFLPEQERELKNFLIEAESTRKNIAGIVVGELIHKGRGHGYESIFFDGENTQLWVQNVQIERGREIEITTKNSIIGNIHSNFSSFISIENNDLGLDLNFPLNITLSNTKRNKSETESIEGITISLRCKNWNQIKACKSLISKFTKPGEVNFLYSGIGEMKSEELLRSKNFNTFVINYSYSPKAEFQTIYEIEKATKSFIERERLSKIVPKALLRVEKIFPRKDSRPKILGVEIKQGTLESGDVLIIGEGFFKIMAITSKGIKVTNPTIRQQVGLLLNSEDFSSSKGKVIKSFNERDLKSDIIF